MKDEAIKELFDKWFDCPMSDEEFKTFKNDKGDWKRTAFTAGCRVAERLAKIEVLEEIVKLCDTWRFTGNIQARALLWIAELKEAMK